MLTYMLLACGPGVIVHFSLRNLELTAGCADVDFLLRGEPPRRLHTVLGPRFDLARESPDAQRGARDPRRIARGIPRDRCAHLTSSGTHA